MSDARHLDSTPPPALTWLHLLPAQSELCCNGGPEWLRAHLTEYSAIDGSPVGVSWEKLPEITANSGGIVAVNCPKIPESSLRSASFKYVRRFAAMPNLRNMRWLVPLESPVISSAAFSLYTPTRLSAKLKRFAVRLATHLRLPVWYREQICIALPEVPPLEKAIANLFPGEEVQVALSSGAPEGARNRKASALVMGKDGKLLAFVKLARSAIARTILANEADVLPRLTHLLAPRLLFQGEVDGTRVLVQSPLQGQPAPVALTAAHRAFLDSLQTSERSTAASVMMVRNLGGRLAALSPAHPDLIESLEQTLPTLEAFAVPVTIVHGDFAPWNLRLHEGRVSAFDWEYAEFSGLPLIDEIHYRLQVGMMLENWDISRAHQYLHEFAQSRPLKLAPQHVLAIAMIYLLDALARLLGEGYGLEHDMIVWHRGVLERITRSQGTPSRTEVAA